MVKVSEPLVGRQIEQTTVSGGLVTTVESGGIYVTSVSQGGPLDGWQVESSTVRNARRAHWAVVKLADESVTYS